MAVQLWDDKDANMIDSFDHEEAALAAVRDTVERHGIEAVATWALDRLDDRPMIRGARLVRRAMHGSGQMEGSARPLHT